jgi:probable HAF family extracellular repeat protein
MTKYTFTTLDGTGNGINDSGEIVGTNAVGGFLYIDGTYTTISDPEAAPLNTNPLGINNEGDIVGSYTNSTGQHGFLDIGGIYTTIDFGTASTIAAGINDLGQIVGSYDAQGAGGATADGFLYSGGIFTTLAIPGAIFTVPTGINDLGQIVGHYILPGSNFAHGFLYSGGVFTTIDDPLAISGHGSSNAVGINDLGQIVGFYTDNSGGFPPHGFLYSNGVYTTIDNPGAPFTELHGINDLGQIVGNDFIATPIPNPAMLNVVSDHGLSTLSGTAEANANVSIFDGTKLVGTVAATAHGTWSLQTKLGNGVHSFTETSTDLAGNSVSSAGVTLYAQNANQQLKGGTGNDVLIGNRGDTLTGGTGADNFVFNPSLGKETIKDFNVNQDVITFDHTLFTNATASQVLSQTHDTAAGAVIVVDAQDTVSLTGVHLADLQSHLNDFHFI